MLWFKVFFAVSVFHHGDCTTLDSIMEERSELFGNEVICAATSSCYDCLTSQNCTYWVTIETISPRPGICVGNQEILPLNYYPLYSIEEVEECKSLPSPTNDSFASCEQELNCTQCVNSGCVLHLAVQALSSMPSVCTVAGASIPISSAVHSTLKSIEECEIYMYHLNGTNSGGGQQIEAKFFLSGVYTAILGVVAVSILLFSMLVVLVRRRLSQKRKRNIIVPYTALLSAMNRMDEERYTLSMEEMDRLHTDSSAGCSSCDDMHEIEL